VLLVACLSAWLQHHSLVCWIMCKLWSVITKLLSFWQYNCVSIASMYISNNTEWNSHKVGLTASVCQITLQSWLVSAITGLNHSLNQFIPSWQKQVSARVFLPEHIKHSIVIEKRAFFYYTKTYWQWVEFWDLLWQQLILHLWKLC